MAKAKKATKKAEKPKKTPKAKPNKAAVSKPKTTAKKKAVTTTKKKTSKPEVKSSEMICAFCGNTPKDTRSLLGTQKKYLSAMNVSKNLTRYFLNKTKNIGALNY